MEHAETWLTAVKLVGGALTVILIAIAGVITGKRATTQAPAVEGEVVAATFTERAVLERLIAALVAVEATLTEHHEEVRKLNGHLEHERHDRELAKAVRDALDERGRGK